MVEQEQTFNVIGLPREYYQNHSVESLADVTVPLTEIIYQWRGDTDQETKVVIGGMHPTNNSVKAVGDLVRLLNLNIPLVLDIDQENVGHLQAVAKLNGVPLEVVHGDIASQEAWERYPYSGADVVICDYTFNFFSPVKLEQFSVTMNHVLSDEGIVVARVETPVINFKPIRWFLRRRYAGSMGMSYENLHLHTMSEINQAFGSNLTMLEWYCTEDGQNLGVWVKPDSPLLDNKKMPEPPQPRHIGEL